MSIAVREPTRQLLRAHWFCLVPLFPFIAMLANHRAIGLSDALGGMPAGQPPPTTGELLYNYAMVLAFYMGVVGYLVFAVARAVVDVQDAINTERAIEPGMLAAI